MRWRWRGAARACAWSKPTRPPDHSELARARIEYAAALTLLHRNAAALALAPR